MYEEPPYQEEGNIQEKVVMMIMLIEGHIEIGDPLKEGDIQIKVEGHLIKEDILVEGLLGEDIPIEMEDPQEEDTQEEDPLMVEDPLMEMEDPLMVEVPWRWRTPWTSWWTRTTRSSRTPWTCETHNSADSSSNITYICSRKYF